MNLRVYIFLFFNHYSSTPTEEWICTMMKPKIKGEFWVAMKRIATWDGAPYQKNLKLDFYFR